MYTDAMRRAFHNIQAPLNFGINLIDNDTFITIKLDERSFLHLSHDQKIEAVQYVSQVKKALEMEGAIVFARFLPIIRTFAPIIAGIVRMDKSKFTFYNIVGCIAWVFSMMFAGHYLYKFFLSQYGFDLKERLEFIVLGIVFVTTAPVIIKLMKGKSK